MIIELEELKVKNKLIDINLEVEYQWYGSYYKKTLTSPEEFPEMEITKMNVISHSLKDGSEVLREVPEWLENAIPSGYLEDKCIEDSNDRCDY
jgi:hypothetical protein